ncbi:hypothetical protein K439DRAFT_1653773 [Ramaria rubella]|nr:hypothetical protein K439DRAFT_1653773 [Ramaria rubella]
MASWRMFRTLPRKVNIGQSFTSATMQPHDRKSSFKIPPIAEKETSQHVRRTKALEEQKRRRAKRVDSSRSLDNFAGLSLGSNDDDPEIEAEVMHEGVAHLASLLTPQNNASESAPTSKDKSRKPRKPNTHFANKIMYAELLEMKDDQMLVVDGNGGHVGSDGLPIDLDTNWVALAPVPQGKRCLAVSNQSSNIPGTVTNTFLKSRLKGRTIMTFPSPLPPATILDCILDDNWKINGLIHVLDIIRWKGQELAECEANFRFWWRDTRLSELISLPCPLYIFSFPTAFLPVPYHLDLSVSALLSIVIPVSRSVRRLPIQLPSYPDTSRSSGQLDDDMEIDHINQEVGVQPEVTTAEIQPDGLLLYVSQASYEPGTSPLSSWVPIKSYREGHESPLVLFERLVTRRASSNTGAADFHR